MRPEAEGLRPAIWSYSRSPEVCRLTICFFDWGEARACVLLQSVAHRAVRADSHHRLARFERPLARNHEPRMDDGVCEQFIVEIGMGGLKVESIIGPERAEIAGAHCLCPATDRIQTIAGADALAKRTLRD